MALFLPATSSNQLPVFYVSTGAVDAMAIPYASILTSSPFKFLVGPDKKLFTVHSALVAHHSKPLGVLVSGNMSEAKEGCAFLKDIDEDTFVRFSQYAYTGDYVTADPEILLDASTTEMTSVTDEASPAEAPPDLAEELVAEDTSFPEQALDAPADSSTFHDNDGWGRMFVSKSDKKKGKTKRGVFSYEPYQNKNTGTSSKSMLWDTFKTMNYATCKPTTSFQVRKNREPCENYTEVFLCHARLYAFADKYDIGPLKRLSLHKLHQTLVEFTLYKERVGDVVELIRYSYTNTADLSGRIDELRSLVVHYAACVVEHLAWNPEFRSLLEQPGSFAKDLVAQMLQRLD